MIEDKPYLPVGAVDFQVSVLPGDIYYLYMIENKPHLPVGAVDF